MTRNQRQTNLRSQTERLWIRNPQSKQQSSLSLCELLTPGMPRTSLKSFERAMIRPH